MDNLLAGQSAADTWRRRGKVKGQAIGRTVNCQGSIGIIRTQWNLVMGARKSYDGRTTVVARERGSSKKTKLFERGAVKTALVIHGILRSLSVPSRPPACLQRAP